MGRRREGPVVCDGTVRDDHQLRQRDVQWRGLLERNGESALRAVGEARDPVRAFAYQWRNSNLRERHAHGEL